MKTRNIFHSGICILTIEAFLIATITPRGLQALTSSDSRVSTSGTNTTVNTGMDASAVIQWTDFNTEFGDVLEFQNGLSRFAVLNRVTGDGGTFFDGRLIGNQGYIFVVDPSGIVFGPNAEITAAGFTASGLNIDDLDFMNGHYAFAGGTGKVENYGSITAGHVALIGSHVFNSGTIHSPGGTVILASGTDIFLGSENSEIIVRPAALPEPGVPVSSGDVINGPDGQITNPGGQIILAAGDTFVQAVEGLSSLSLSVSGTKGHVKQYGIINADNPAGPGGTVAMSAVKDVIIQAGSSTTAEGTDSSTGGDINLSGTAIKIYEDLQSATGMRILANDSVITSANLTSGGDMTIESTNKGTYIGGTAQSGGDLSITAGTYISFDGDAVSGGNITLETGSNNTYALGNLLAEGDIDLLTDLYLGGGQWVEESGITWQGDQAIRSNSGTVTAEGLIRKETPGQLFISGGGTNEAGVSVALNHSGPEPAVSNGGNIYISGLGDVQIAGDIIAVAPGSLPFPPESDGPINEPAPVGGVAVFSETGGIYTPGSDAVEVTIMGYSNEVFTTEPIGVDLPYADGKAAVELVSQDTLKIGSNAEIIAFGAYLPATEENEGGGVDNRPGIDFLAEDAAIGGYDREKGIASDVAIYLASTEGNVEINTPHIYVSSGIKNGVDQVRISEIPFGPATVVFDAYDTVLMSFLNGETEPYNYRLEVVSRITEWLSQAISNQTLPFADNPETMKEMYVDYVLRGAGDYPDYPDTRAWVLEDPSPTPDPAVPPLADLILPEISGCPVELEAAAAELGISADDLQLRIGSSLALNPNLNACQACARLINASRILSDEGGLRLAAMNQIFNTLAPAEAPFTPEMSASVMVAFAELGDQDAQYALANEYVEAFVEYVAVLDTQLRIPVGDPVALVLNKYGSDMFGTDNPNIQAFVLSRIQSVSDNL